MKPLSALSRSLLALLFCSLLGIAQAQPDRVDADLHSALGETGSVRVLVHFQDTADKRDTNGVSASDIRRRHAVRDSILAQLPAKSKALRRGFDSLAVFAAEVSSQDLEILLRDPRVLRIGLDLPGAGNMPEAAPLARITDVQALGVQGQGARIAVFDTGIDPSHPDFSGRVVAQACFCSTSGSSGGCCPNGQRTQFGPGSTFDDHGHGTHVTGIAAGGGAIARPGVASEAEIISIKVLDANNQFCCGSDILAAMDWLSINHPGTVVSNLSLGTFATFPGHCDNANSFNQAAATVANRLRDGGMQIFASTGNQGRPLETQVPACLSKVAGIGAVWDAPRLPTPFAGCTETMIVTDQATCFSNSSTTTAMYAPGAFITSSAPGFGLSTRGGTSMSSPMVAGCATSLRAAFPEATADDVDLALLSSPTTITDAKNGLSFPRLDCKHAYDLLQAQFAALNHTGIYFQAAAPGHAVTVSHQDQALFVAWYNYADDGRPIWFASTATQTEDGGYAGEYLSFEGIPFAQIDGAPAVLANQTRGEMRLDFDGNGGLELSFAPLDAATQTRSLERFLFAADAPTCRFSTNDRADADNYSDLWWQPSESGWGLTLDHQGDGIFAAWYTYAADQQPIWMAAQLDRQQDGSFAGPLLRTQLGLPYTQTPDGPVTSFPLPAVGTATLQFSDGETGAFGYSLDGIERVRPITRFVFGKAVARCD